MEGRIIALRVSEADFACLEAIKKLEGIGWNQLLLVPVETVRSITLETARPAVKVKVEVVPDKPKGKKASKPKTEKASETPPVKGIGGEGGEMSPSDYVPGEE